MPNRFPKFLVLAAIFFVTAAAALYRAATGSLPILDGDLPLAALTAPVSVERDVYGVPTIRGSNRADVARATGFVHGQDRFFQMDLLRRSTAGELAELFGPLATGADRERRRYRMRTVARQVIARAPPAERALLDAYTEGVNAGIEALAVSPFEYLVLRSAPEPWRTEDIVLGNLAMFFVLTDYDASRESGFAALIDGLPEEIRRFVFAPGNRWDAPMSGDSWEVPPIPGAQSCDLRSTAPVENPVARKPARTPDLAIDAPAPGSNAWAVAGHRSAAGRAIVANDMHLGLDVPNTWYRVRLIVGDPGETPRLELAGVTLPGTPVVVAGSNSSIAWGFTNSRGDWADLVLLQTAPDNPDLYLTPDGYVPFEEYEETIEVKGSEPEIESYRWTRWGPVVGTDHRGRLLALRWLGHLPEAVNLRLHELETAASVGEALALAPEMGIPPQNFVVADSQGSVGWTIMGRIPRRMGYDPAIPASWADGTVGWQGWLLPAEYPRVADPESGLIWTANSRGFDGDVLTHVGANGFRLGARSQQIRDALMDADPATMEDMLAIQLDDRALLQQEWRDALLLALADPAAESFPWRRDVSEILKQWNGRAGVDAAGYRIAREFRRRVHSEVLNGILTGCGDIEPPIRLTATDQAEGPVWQLIEERPAHLLPPPHTSWTELLLHAAGSAVADCGAGSISACTWENTGHVTIKHPLADALPVLRPWLVVHDGPLPGGDHVPRVQWHDFGASERFGVSPGDESNGYFHMPGGQSGHPLSPYFSAGHEAWASGEPLPFLPGPAAHLLTLSPQ